MNLYHGKFRSAIKLFPELHTGNITDNNWQSSCILRVKIIKKQGRHDLYYNVFLSLETSIEKYVNIEHLPFVNVMIFIEIYELKQ